MRKVFLALLAAALPAISALADVPAEEQMAHRIGSQLKQSGQLHNYEIGVKYHEGIAYLEGKVTSPEQRATAIRLAQKVKGVSRVECKLAVTNQSKSDANVELASATEEGLPDDSQGESSNSHAYQQREPAMMPNQQMMMAGSARMNGMRSARNNMPLPSRQMPSMMPVRQAGCQSCNGGGMGGPGGAPGMCGPGGPGMDGGAPMGYVPQGGGSGRNYDNASMPGCAGQSYAL